MSKEEGPALLMEAKQSHTVDMIKRIKEITLVMLTHEKVLESQGVTPDDMEDMLEELKGYVEATDNITNDLNSIGGLYPLVGFLKNRHANLRAKAADVLNTIVQNNPKSQQLVMYANGLEHLLSNFTTDLDTKVRTKSLVAISSLIRHNNLCAAAFRLANGYASLRDALSSDSEKFQRKALNLIQYLLHESRSDSAVVTELGFPRLIIHLASNEVTAVREAALGCLLELARDKPDGSSLILSVGERKLKELLEERIRGIGAMTPDELSAAREERQLVDSLWIACYKEPSSLWEQGLLVLPGEGASPPDVASKHFEPPMSALSAGAEDVKRRSEEDGK